MMMGGQEGIMKPVTGLLALWILLLGLATCRSAPSPATAHVPRLLENLGDHSHPISTRVPLAQRYFDQGLVLTYGFNHEGAIDAFREAARLDPECAMCFWGIALAHGPNINAPMGPDGARAAWEALQAARRLAPKASPAEQAYIEALSARYASEPAADRATLDRAFADAMRELHRRFPEDSDAATLFAEAVMDLMPWDYWTPDGKPRVGTEEVVRTLEAVLARDPQHPGANHYLIHALEEHQPERAEAAADRLAKIAPDAGHLVHMPSHIYWRVGRYQDATEINELAAAADVAYFAWCRSPVFYAAAYYNHNVHFLWSAAAMEGRSDLALTAARRLAANIPAAEIATYPWLEDFLTVPVLTLARFGRWDRILGEPRPSEALPYATGIWHYTRGLALTRQGRLEEAGAELAAFERIARDPALDALVYDVAGGTAGQRLRVGLHHLQGELLAARGDRPAAVRALEEAVRAQDAMNYIEPPAWYFPVRQALGAVLLDARRPAEAEAVYRVDLQHYPRNGWSLFGLEKSLRAQGKQVEAKMAASGFANAWTRADVELSASRF